MAPKTQEFTETFWDSSELEETQEIEQQQQRQQKDPPFQSQKFKKVVRFSATATVRQIPKWTKTEAGAVWFTNNDFNAMKKAYAPTVQLMFEDIAPEEDTDEHCTRGLEYRTRDGGRKRTKNKYKAMAAVLHEQDRQICEDQYDPELLAEVYRRATDECVLEALSLGRKDEQDVLSYGWIDENLLSDVRELHKQQIQKQHQWTSDDGTERGLRRSIRRLWGGGSRMMRRNSTGFAA